MLLLGTTKSFKKLLLQAASSVLVLSFFVQDLAWAAPEIKVSIPMPSVWSSGPAFPREIAEAQDSFRGSSERTIYLLQDAHTNFSAQKNIASAIRHLLEKEKLHTVYVEGGFGYVSLSALKKTASAQKREEVGMKYLRSGELSGAEYLNLTGTEDFELAGVEDRELYWKSLELYRTVAKDREKFKAYLAQIDRSIETLKPELLRPLLRGFDRKRQDFLDGKLSFSEYFSSLSRYAGWFDVPLMDYPELSKIASLSELEARIDFKAANEEAAKAARFIEEKKPEAGKLTSLNAQSVEAFYALLEEKLTRSVIARSPQGDEAISVAQIASASTTPRNDYKELFKYFDYLAKARAIQPAELLHEQGELEAALLEKLAETPDEKKLLEAGDRLRQWQSLISLSLLPNEFQALSGTESLDLRALTGFLNEKIMELEDHYDRVIFLNEDFEKTLATAEEFYELTKKRDALFIERMLTRMAEKGETKAALVAGGYHSPNLKALLKEKNISFVCVTPKILNETNISRYEKLLLNQSSEPAAVKADALALLAVQSRVPGPNSEILTGARLAEQLVQEDGSAATMARPAVVLPTRTVSLAEWIQANVIVPGRHVYADYWEGSTHFLKDAIEVFVNGRPIDTRGKLGDIRIPVDSKVSLSPKDLNRTSGARLAGKSGQVTNQTALKPSAESKNNLDSNSDPIGLAISNFSRDFLSLSNSFVGILTRMIPWWGEFEGWAKKSESWVTKIRFSDTAKARTLPLDIPFGEGLTSWPKRESTARIPWWMFSSIRKSMMSLSQERGLKFFLFQDTSGIVESGADMVIAQAGVRLANFFKGRPAFEHLEHKGDHDTGAFKTGLPVANVGVNGDKLLDPSHDAIIPSGSNQVHTPTFGARLAGNGNTARQPILDRLSELRDRDPEAGMSAIDLSNVLGFGSETPIRMALRQLMDDGLVEEFRGVSPTTRHSLHLYRATGAGARLARGDLLVGNKLFPGHFDILGNFADQTAAYILALVNGHGRSAAIGMGEAGMATLLADFFKPKFFENLDDLNGLERGKPLAQTATLTSWRPTNLSGFGVFLSALRQTLMALWMRLSNSVMFFAWLWHPRILGTEATSIPSSSTSIKTTYSSDIKKPSFIKYTPTDTPEQAGARLSDGQARLSQQEVLFSVIDFLSRAVAELDAFAVRDANDKILFRDPETETLEQVLLYLRGQSSQFNSSYPRGSLKETARRITNAHAQELVGLAADIWPVIPLKIYRYASGLVERNPSGVQVWGRAGKTFEIFKRSDNSVPYLTGEIMSVRANRFMLKMTDGNEQSTNWPMAPGMSLRVEDAITISALKSFPNEGKIVIDATGEYLIYVVPFKTAGARLAGVNPYGPEKNVTRNLDELRSVYGDKLFDELERTSGENKPLRKVLLIGAGRGVTALEMAHKYPNLHITAVNLEEGLWDPDKARKELLGLGLTGQDVEDALRRIERVAVLDIQKDEVSSTSPLGRDKFDFVIVERNVWQYIESKVETLERLYNERVAVGGVFAFILYGIEGGAAMPEIDWDPNVRDMVFAAMTTGSGIAEVILKALKGSSALISKNTANLLEPSIVVKKINDKPIQIPLKFVRTISIPLFIGLSANATSMASYYKISQASAPPARARLAQHEYILIKDMAGLLRQFAENHPNGKVILYPLDSLPRPKEELSRSSLENTDQFVKRVKDQVGGIAKGAWMSWESDQLIIRPSTVSPLGARLAVPLFINDQAERLDWHTPGNMAVFTDVGKTVRVYRSFKDNKYDTALPQNAFDPQTGFPAYFDLTINHAEFRSNGPKVSVTIHDYQGMEASGELNLGNAVAVGREEKGRADVMIQLEEPEVDHKPIKLRLFASKAEYPIVYPILQSHALEAILPLPLYLETMPKNTDVVLMRHAEADIKFAGRAWRGAKQKSGKSKLTREGEKQAKQAAEKLIAYFGPKISEKSDSGDWKYDFLILSPRSERTARTARIISRVIQEKTGRVIKAQTLHLSKWGDSGSSSSRWVAYANFLEDSRAHNNGRPAVAILVDHSGFINGVLKSAQFEALPENQEEIPYAEPFLYNPLTVSFESFSGARLAEAKTGLQKIPTSLSFIGKSSMFFWVVLVLAHTFAESISKGEQVSIQARQYVRFIYGNIPQFVNYHGGSFFAPLGIIIAIFTAYPTVFPIKITRSSLAAVSLLIFVPILIRELADYFLYGNGFDSWDMGMTVAGLMVGSWMLQRSVRLAIAQSITSLYYWAGGEDLETVDLMTHVFPNLSTVKIVDQYVAGLFARDGQKMSQGKGMLSRRSLEFVKNLKTFFKINKEGIREFDVVFKSDSRRMKISLDIDHLSDFKPDASSTPAAYVVKVPGDSSYLSVFASFYATLLSKMKKGDIVLVHNAFLRPDVLDSPSSGLVRVDSALLNLDKPNVENLKWGVFFGFGIGLRAEVMNDEDFPHIQEDDLPYVASGWMAYRMEKLPEEDFLKAKLKEDRFEEKFSFRVLPASVLGARLAGKSDRLKVLEDRILRETGAKDIVEFSLARENSARFPDAAKHVIKLTGWSGYSGYLEIRRIIQRISDELSEQSDKRISGKTVDKDTVIANEGFALFEMLKNAYVHGNQYDGNEPIYVAVSIKRGILKIDVFDMALKETLGWFDLFMLPLTLLMVSFNGLHYLSGYHRAEFGLSEKGSYSRTSMIDEETGSVLGTKATFEIKTGARLSASLAEESGELRRTGAEDGSSARQARQEIMRRLSELYRTDRQRGTSASLLTRDLKFKLKNFTNVMLDWLIKEKLVEKFSVKIGTYNNKPSREIFYRVTDVDLWPQALEEAEQKAGSKIQDTQELAREFIQGMKFDPDLKVVSVGPGYHWLNDNTPWEKLFLRSGAQVQMYEPREDSRDTWQEFGGQRKNLAIFSEAFQENSIPDNTQDAVIVMSVFSFYGLSDQEKVNIFYEALRVLKPGGYLIVGHFNAPETIASDEYELTQAILDTRPPSISLDNLLKGSETQLQDDGSRPHDWNVYRVNKTSKPRLLILDPNSDSAESTKALYEGDYAVTTASSLQEAERFVSLGEPFDWVISKKNLAEKGFREFISRTTTADGQSVFKIFAGAHFLKWLATSPKRPKEMFLDSKEFRLSSGARLAGAVWTNPRSERHEEIFQLDQFKDARTVLKGVTENTPLIPLKRIGELTEKTVLMKEEGAQVSGSFKMRGVYYEVYSALRGVAQAAARGDASAKTNLQKGVRIVTQSTGNHAIAMVRAVPLAVARLSEEFKSYPDIVEGLKRVEPIVFSYRDINGVKRKLVEEALRDYRALYGEKKGAIFAEFDDYEEAKKARIRFVEENGPSALYMDHGGRTIMLGHGTMGLEITEQLRAMGIGEDKKVALLLPIGEGGPLGVGAAMVLGRKNVKVVMVQAEGLSAFRDTLITGTLQKNPPLSTAPLLSDGIAVDGPDDKAIAVAETFVDQAVAIPEGKALKYRGEGPVRIGGTGLLSVGALFEYFKTLDSIREADLVVLINTESNVEEELVAAGARLAEKHYSGSRRQRIASQLTDETNPYRPDGRWTLQDLAYVLGYSVSILRKNIKFMKLENSPALVDESIDDRTEIRVSRSGLGEIRIANGSEERTVFNPDRVAKAANEEIEKAAGLFRETNNGREPFQLTVNGVTFYRKKDKAIFVWVFKQIELSAFDFAFDLRLYAQFQPDKAVGISEHGLSLHGVKNPLIVANSINAAIHDSLHKAKQSEGGVIRSVSLAGIELFPVKANIHMIWAFEMPENKEGIKQIVSRLLSVSEARLKAVFVRDMESRFKEVAGDTDVLGKGAQAVYDHLHSAIARALERSGTVEKAREPVIEMITGAVSVFANSSVEGKAEALIHFFDRQFLENDEPLILRGVVRKSGALWSGKNFLGRFRNHSGSVYALEMKEGFPYKVTFENDGTSEYFSYVRDTETDRIIHAYAGKPMGRHFKKLRDAYFETDLGASGALRIGSGRPLVNGDKPPQTLAWARFDKFPGAKVRVYIKNGLVTRVTSVEPGLDAHFAVVEDGKGKPISSFYVGLSKKEFNLLQTGSVIRGFTLDGDGSLNLGRRRWMILGSEYAYKRVDITSIENTNGNKAFITAAASKNLKRFYLPAPGTAEDSFETGELYGVFENGGNDIFNGENGLLLRSFIIRGYNVSHAGEVNIGRRFRLRSRHYRGASVDVKFIEGEPRYLRFNQDAQGAPILDVRTEKPLTINLRLSYEAQVSHGNSIDSERKIRPMRMKFERGIRAYAAGNPKKAAQVFISLYRDLSGAGLDISYVKELRDKIDEFMSENDLDWQDGGVGREKGAIISPSGVIRRTAVESRPASIEQKALLWGKANSGDIMARQKLTEAYLWFVFDRLRDLTKEYSSLHSELVQEGGLALHEILEEYLMEGSSNQEFSEFVRPRLDERLKEARTRFFGDSYRTISLDNPLGSDTERTLKDVLLSAEAGPDEGLSIGGRKFEDERLNALFTTLTATEQDILWAYYVHELEPEQIAADLRMSTDDISRALEELLGKLPKTSGARLADGQARLAGNSADSSHKIKKLGAIIYEKNPYRADGMWSNIDLMQILGIEIEELKKYQKELSLIGSDRIARDKGSPTISSERRFMYGMDHDFMDIAGDEESIGFEAVHAFRWAVRKALAHFEGDQMKTRRAVNVLIRKAGDMNRPEITAFLRSYSYGEKPSSDGSGGSIDEFNRPALAAKVREGLPPKEDAKKIINQEKFEELQGDLLKMIQLSKTKSFLEHKRVMPLSRILTDIHESLARLHKNSGGDAHKLTDFLKGRYVLGRLRSLKKTHSAILLSDNLLKRLQNPEVYIDYFLVEPPAEDAVSSPGARLAEKGTIGPALESHKEALRPGLSVNESAELIGVSKQGLEGYLNTNPWAYDMYGFPKPPRYPQTVLNYVLGQADTISWSAREGRELTTKDRLKLAELHAYWSQEIGMINTLLEPHLQKSVSGVAELLLEASLPATTHDEALEKLNKARSALRMLLVIKNLKIKPNNNPGARLATVSPGLRNFVLGAYLAVPEGAGMPFALGAVAPLLFRVEGERLSVVQEDKEVFFVAGLPQAVLDWKTAQAERKGRARDVGQVASAVRNTQKKVETLFPSDFKSRTGFLEVDLSKLGVGEIDEAFEPAVERLIDVLAARHGNYYLNLEGLSPSGTRLALSLAAAKRNFANFTFEKPKGMTIVNLHFESDEEPQILSPTEEEYVLRVQAFASDRLANLEPAVAIGVETANFYEQGRGRTEEERIRDLNLSKIPQALAEFSISGDRSSRRSARDVDAYFHGSMDHAQAWTIKAVSIFVKLGEAMRSVLMVEISA